jgi:spore coat polysaccharide biosynthesis protein SpsF
MEQQMVIGIIQARMGSSRLPGKVMLDLEGKPALARVHARAARAESLDKILVATSSEEEDDPIAAFCEDNSISCFRGHATDVLDRLFKAAKRNRAEIVVRITGDCPLIDPDVIDQCVNVFLQADPAVDMVANRLPEHKTFPVGLDTEVCSFEALEQAWTNADQPYQREHVLPYLYEEPARFRVLCIDAPSDYSYFRWTLDTKEDLQLLREIYRRFDGRDTFSWLDVLKLLEREPELSNLNADVPHRTYRDEDPRFMRDSKSGSEKGR